ncbi:telomeric repeat-binding factor 2-interacting protein 1 [Hemicordylus capensis]|uniref:telomeric repeat-binding factor 2-interacting protein 1 n=1 Tax=Hemicordylus capensis TaxID=884348 RepID=UPI0023028333|nr:telomeric repeat-binding factor 2-interacting protein 1 [Hemicordylus capensis]
MLEEGSSSALVAAAAAASSSSSAAAARPVFQREDGSAVRFYMRPGAGKVELAPLILRGGGRLCRLREPGAVCLASAQEQQQQQQQDAAGGGLVSSRYVVDCLARGERLPLEPYRLPASRPRRRGCLAPAGALPSGEATAGDVAQGEASQSPAAVAAALGSKARSIFQMANKEFEEAEGDSESSGPGEDTPPKHTEFRSYEEAASPNLQPTGLGFSPSEASLVPQSPSPEEEQPSGPSAVEVALAVEDMKHFMDEFEVDLATVTQAFLKNSGEVAAVASCLQAGQRLDGRPLWSRQDDVSLLKDDEHLQSKLVARYGAENVARRVAFRRS